MQMMGQKVNLITSSAFFILCVAVSWECVSF